MFLYNKYEMGNNVYENGLTSIPCDLIKNAKSIRLLLRPYTHCSYSISLGFH